MEEQLVHILQQTQSGTGTKAAEAQLESLFTNPSYPLALVSIASHTDVPLNIRQAALLALKNFVLAGWSPQFDEFKGQLLVNDENKARLRHALLELATSGEHDRKVKSAASYVVSKIASADFPEEWPDLLSNLLNLIPTASDSQLHGALKVLGDMVDECFNDEQFFRMARDLVKTVYDVAINDQRKPVLRALAVSVFRGCFDILEMLAEDHKEAVRGFANEALSAWLPFFTEVLKSKLPPPPSEEEEKQDTPALEQYRGTVTLKLQVVKVKLHLLSYFFLLFLDG
jgi:importin-9